jgi:hypothetical protein
MASLTVLEAATLIVHALGIRFGSLEIRVEAGEVTLLRQGETLKPADLEALPLEPDPDVESA